MAYTPIDKSSDHFETILWSSVDTSITGLNFQPDWAWIKSRTNADTHVAFDAVRGANKRLSPSGSTAESTTSDELTSFNSDGYTLGTGANVNRSSNNYVSWNWKANGSGSSNSNGSITSTVSANTTAGFSIVSWSGTGSNATVGHGLSSAPKMVICKRRNADDTWWTYNETVGAGGQLYLNGDAAAGSDGGVLWNSTAPTSSVFSVGTNGGVNGSGGTYVAYAFADVKGFSKINSYTGNGNADGPFVYTGFKPSFVMNKKTDGTMDWHIWDNKRNSFNVIDKLLYPNLNNAEDTLTSLDFVSNGFKIRDNRNFLNTNGSPYIYMAFAENPFVTSTGVAGLAR